MTAQVLSTRLIRRGLGATIPASSSRYAASAPGSGSRSRKEPGSIGISVSGS